MRKNILYAVYHQRELDYLARSYQPGYFFILMGGEYMTEFLAVDGSNKMKADLDLDAYDLLFKDIVLIQSSVNEMVLVDRATKAIMKSWRVAHLYPYSTITSRASNLYVQSRAIDGNTILFRGYDVGLGGYLTCLRIVSDATEPFADIPRAGNITGLAGKILNMPTILSDDFWTSIHYRFAPLTAQPPLWSNILVCADRANWDPLGRGAGARPYLVFYDGAAWKAVSAP